MTEATSLFLEWETKYDKTFHYLFVVTTKILHNDPSFGGQQFQVLNFFQKYCSEELHNFRNRKVSTPDSIVEAPHSHMLVLEKVKRL